MTQAERKMGAYDREAIAIHDAYVHWREYLEGAQSICYTDHSPLVHYLMKQTTLTRRQARILLYLQSFETSIEYIEGSANPVDYFTRPMWVKRGKGDPLEQPETPEPRITAVLTGRKRPHPLSKAPRSNLRRHNKRQNRVVASYFLAVHGKVRTDSGVDTPQEAYAGAQQQNCAAAVHLAISKAKAGNLLTGKRAREAAEQLERELAAADTAPSPGMDFHNLNTEAWVTATQNCERLGPQDTAKGLPLLMTKYSKLSQEGDLYWWQETGKTARLYVPTAMVQQVLKAYHDSPMAGHLGYRKTVQAIKDRFWWPNYKAEVLKYCTECEACQRNKHARQKPLGQGKPSEIPDRPWEFVTMDQITALPETKRGHNAMTVVVDKDSKMVHIIPCTKKTSAEETVHLFNAHVIKHNGMATKVSTERGQK